jgi:hypothetical protein
VGCGVEPGVTLGMLGLLVEGWASAVGVAEPSARGDPVAFAVGEGEPIGEGTVIGLVGLVCGAVAVAGTGGPGFIERSVRPAALARVTARPMPASIRLPLFQRGQVCVPKPVSIHATSRRNTPPHTATPASSVSVRCVTPITTKATMAAARAAPPTCHRGPGSSSGPGPAGSCAPAGEPERPEVWPRPAPCIPVSLSWRPRCAPSLSPDLIWLGALDRSSGRPPLLALCLIEEGSVDFGT